MNGLPIQADVTLTRNRPRLAARNPDAQSARIMAYVAERYGIPVGWLRNTCQEAQYVAPRHVAMYLVWELRGFSMPRIGEIFGGRHHTTVLYAIQKVEQNRTEPRVAAFLEEAKQDLAELLQGPILKRSTPGVLHVPDVRKAEVA